MNVLQKGEGIVGTHPLVDQIDEFHTFCFSPQAVLELMWSDIDRSRSIASPASPAGNPYW
jgi:hypothetical protein